MHAALSLRALVLIVLLAGSTAASATPAADALQALPGSGAIQLDSQASVEIDAVNADPDSWLFLERDGSELPSVVEFPTLESPAPVTPDPLAGSIVSAGT